MPRRHHVRARRFPCALVAILLVVMAIDDSAHATGKSLSMPPLGSCPGPALRPCLHRRTDSIKGLPGVCSAGRSIRFGVCASSLFKHRGGRMRRSYALPVSWLLTIPLVACTGRPAIHYRYLPAATDSQATPMMVKVGKGSAKPPTSDDPANPGDGEFVFALQVSTIAFAAPSDVKKDDEKPGSDGRNADRSKARPPAGAERNKASGGGEGSAGKQRGVDPTEPTAYLESPRPPIPSDAQIARCGPDHAWTGCWSGLIPATAPHPDFDYIYSGRPSNGLKLSAAVGSDPLSPKTISSNWTNPAAGAISRVAGEIGAGWGLAGPVGAFVVLIGGEIATASTKGKEYSDVYNPSPRWESATKFLCNGESTDSGPDANYAHALLLPVALDLDRSLPQEPKTGTTLGCWHRFPKSDSNYVNRGWFYRLLEDPSPTPPIKQAPPVYYVDRAGKSQGKGITNISATLPTLPPSESQAYVPVSACHAVVLEITWWTEAAVAGAFVMPDNFDVTHAVRYHVVIADPHLIQQMTVGKGPRTIAYDANCGATATGAPAPNDGEANSQAVIKGVQDIRKAQQDWSKSHSD